MRTAILCFALLLIFPVLSSARAATGDTLLYYTDFSRLSPSEGLRRLLSPRTCVRTGLALAKIGVVCWIGYAAIRSDLPRIVRAPRLAPRELAGEAGSLAAGLGLKIAAALLVLGMLDFLYQRWQFRREMRMTRSEFLADMRQMQGDPTVRRRRFLGAEKYPAVSSSWITCAAIGSIIGRATRVMRCQGRLLSAPVMLIHSRRPATSSTD